MIFPVSPCALVPNPPSSSQDTKVNEIHTCSYSDTVIKILYFQRPPPTWSTRVCILYPALQSTWDEPFWNSEITGSAATNTSRAQLYPLSHWCNQLHYQDANTFVFFPLHPSTQRGLLIISCLWSQQSWTGNTGDMHSAEQWTWNKEAGYLGTTTLSTFWQRLH